MDRDDFFDHGQAQSHGSPIFGRSDLIGLIETIEDLVLILRGDPDPVVFDDVLLISDTEAGLSFQRGNSQLPHRWLPYLRKGSRFVYGTRAILPGTRIFMKAYYGDGAVHLQIDNEVAGSIEVSLDTSSLRARRVPGHRRKSRSEERRGWTRRNTDLPRFSVRRQRKTGPAPPSGCGARRG